jgi:hypothetical protein
MKREEFVEYLASNPETYEWSEGENEGKDGIYVKNCQFETVTHFSDIAIEKNELNILLEQTSHGKNVEQITRVTGFFSKVSSWNKGKLGELKERNRVNKLK